MYVATINNGRSGEDENRIYMRFEDESLEEVVASCETVLKNMEADGSSPYIFIQRKN